MSGKIKSRLSFMFFNASTEFSELILGSISFITGIWLILPFCHWIFNSWQVNANMPEFWGALLIIAGLLKMIGIIFENFTVRIFSAFVACNVWTYLTASWYFGSDSIHKLYILTSPITLVLAFFNILIFIKLRMVKHVRK